MKALFLFGMLLAAPLFSQALEPQNPVSLCAERFIVGAPKEDCEKKMKALKPDWYLATVCNQSFDDKAFWKCVELTKTGQFSPVQLETCGGDELTDIDRLDCVNEARASKSEAFQQRAPASAKKKKK